MAVAEIIGAAVGVMLLVIVAYVLVGSVLTSAEIVTNAQKDITLQQEIRLRTDFKIMNPVYGVDTSTNTVRFNITLNNIGSEVIRDFSHMDIFVYNASGSIDYQYLTPNNDCSTHETWCYSISGNGMQNQLDPDKAMVINATFTLWDPSYNSIRVVTGNGVYDSTTI
jgi:archaeal flagellar protein FlaF